MQRQPLLNLTLKAEADVVGFQGATAKQANEIQAGLKSEYSCTRTSAGPKSDERHVKS